MPLERPGTAPSPAPSSVSNKGFIVSDKELTSQHAVMDSVAPTTKEDRLVESALRSAEKGAPRLPAVDNALRSATEKQKQQDVARAELEAQAAALEEARAAAARAEA